MIDPGTASLIGTGIQTAGSLVGGLLGDSGGLNRDATIFQAEQQRKLARDLLKDKFITARKFGIHPLAAAGMPMATTTLTPVSSESARGVFSAGAQALGGLAGDFAREALADEDELRKLQMEKVRAEIERLKAETSALAPQPGPEVFPIPEPAAVNVGPIQTGYREYDVLPVDEAGRRFIQLPGGGTFYPDTNVTPAETIEGIYGDVAQELFGLPQVVTDAAGNMDRGLGIRKVGPDEPRISPEWWPDWLPYIKFKVRRR